MSEKANEEEEEVMSDDENPDAKKFVCRMDKCSAKYKAKRNLHAHLRKKHFIETIKCYECEKCPATFRTKAKLKEHTQVVHTQRNFQCEQCEAKFETDFQKSAHANRVHKLKEHDGVVLYFLSKMGFNQWKTEEEDATSMRFKKITGTSNLKKNKATVEYYCCDRSGEYQTKGTGKRRLKSQGSKKIGKKCNAKVTVWTYNDGHVKVVYTPIHCHALDDAKHFGHLRPRKEDTVERKLHQLLNIVKTSNNVNLARMVSDTLEGTIAMAKSINEQPQTSASSLSQASITCEPTNKVYITKQHQLMESSRKKKRSDFSYKSSKKPRVEENVVILESMEGMTEVILHDGGTVTTVNNLEIENATQSIICVPIPQNATQSMFTDEHSYANNY